MSDAPVRYPLKAWSAGEKDGRLYLNATAVALKGRAAMFLGASGSGKSSLALGLMAHGADLIADDGLWAADINNEILLSRPDTAPALIEARGVGLLPSGPLVSNVPLVVAVDLDTAPTDRMPPLHMVVMESVARPLIHGAGLPDLLSVVLHMLRHGPPEI